MFIRSVISYSPLEDGESFFMLSIARESNMYSPTTARLLLGCAGFSSM